MEQVLPYLPKQVLPDLARCLCWNPQIGLSITAQFKLESKFLQSVAAAEQEEWLDFHRESLSEEVRKAGRSRWGNFWDTKSRVAYGDSVRAVAKAVGVSFGDRDSIDRIEAKVIEDRVGKVLGGMTAEQKEAWWEKVRQEAAKYGVSVKTETAGLGAIGLAQASGFGIYLAASTVLGAINGALSLGLGIGTFMGMSKVISLVIGPAGAVVFVIPLIWKAAQADVKKLLPVVAFMAQYRNAREVRLARAFGENRIDNVLELIREIVDRRGIEPLAAVLQCQPDSRRKSAFYAFEVVVGAFRGNLGRGFRASVERLFTQVQSGPERRELVSSITAEVTRLASESLDGTLAAFLQLDADLLTVCYLTAPEGGETEYLCVVTIATRLAETIGRSITA
jgi:uncharacterized protein YaaW (UPF0174 family)